MHPPATVESSWRAWGRSWPRATFGCLSLVAAVLIAIAIPRHIGMAVNGLLGPQPKQDVPPHVLIIILLALAQIGLRVLGQLTLISVAVNTERQLRDRLFAHLMKLDREFFRVHATGDLTSRFSSDITAVSTMWSLGVMWTFGAGMLVLASLVVMFSIEPMLTLRAVSPVPVLMFVAYKVGRAVKRRSAETQREVGNFAAAVQEDLAGIGVIRNYQLETRRGEHVAARSTQLVRTRMHAQIAEGGYAPLLSVFGAFSMLAVLWAGGTAVIEGRMSVGVLVQFNSYLAMVVFLIIWLGDVVSTFQRGLASWSRIAEVLSIQPAILDGAGPELRAPIAGAIEIRDLTIERDGRRLLDGVSLHIPAGTTCAIVGRVGSGKSTLAESIPRLVDVPPSTVFVDGRDVTDLPLASLRCAVAYAAQTPFLMSQTVAENIALGVPAAVEVDATRIQRAARAAGLDADLAALPNGLDTQVGERGITVSGGQRQRIALARALASSRPIVVLDDSLSAVDATTERQILEHLDRELTGRTLILISHRVAAVRRAHQIAVLDAGKLVERGTHDELLARAGIYAELYREQLEGRTVNVTRRLARLVVKQWQILAGAVGLLAVLTVLEAGVPYVLKIIFDRHITAKVLDGLAPLALLFAGGLILRGLIAMALARTLVLLGQRAMHDLRCRLHAHVVTRNHAFFDRTPLGTLLSGITSDVEALSGLFTSGVVTLGVDLVVLIVIIATMTYLSAQLTLVTLASGLVLIPLFALARGPMRVGLREVRAYNAAMMAFVIERLSGVATVQAYGAEAAEQRVYADKVMAYKRSSLAAARASVIPLLVSDGIAAIAGAVVLWYSARLVNVTLTVGLVLAFVEYTRRVFGPVQSIAQKYGVLQAATSAAERIFTLLDNGEADAPARTVESVVARSGDDVPALELKDVEFAYRPGTPVIAGVSLAVPRGATVAVVGATGSGKSTLVRLLARHYEPQVGSLHVDGRDVRDWSTGELRRRLTLISQDVFLFSGTVADNVRIGRADASLADIETALERVGAEGRLRGEGLHAQVGERGVNLSAGERQLVAFARALVRDPEVLLLDEATANVDPQTEQTIERAIAALFAGRTCLIVAHRLSTIRRADRIVVVSAGRIVEAGTRAELLRLGGHYARLEATGALHLAATDTAAVLHDKNGQE